FSIAGLASRSVGDLDRALRSAQEAVTMLDPGTTEPTYQKAMAFVLALARLGWVLGEENAISLGRSHEAVDVLHRAFRIADSYVHKDSDDEAARARLFVAGSPLADVLRHSDSVQ